MIDGDRLNYSTGGIGDTRCVIRWPPETTHHQSRSLMRIRLKDREKMTANLGGVDIKDLEGRKDGENRPAVQSRDFFWDSLTLFVVGAILALSAIDFLFEWIRGSRVQCFFNQSALIGQSLGNVGEYINERCATYLPPAEYLPAFIAIHSLLVLAPHYVWLNAYGAKLDSFFHLASTLFRTKDPNTGAYPDNNYVISKQLDPFNSEQYRSNWMFFMYLAKLGLQIVVSVGGLCLAAGTMIDFDETFPCPKNDDDRESDDWPLAGDTARCVFTSLRLLHKVWIAYFILLSVTIICLILAFIWLVATHPEELGIEKVVKFSFETSLPFYRYKPLLIFRSRSGLSPLVYWVVSFFPTFSYWSNKSFHITSDYDFLLVKLFRTDRGLAQVLKEVQMHRLLKDENNMELARVSTHKTAAKWNKQKKDQFTAMVGQDFLHVGVGWKDFELVDKHNTVDVETPLLLPPTIRGVVVGHSARCVGSKISPPQPGLPDELLCGALCIVFDSESVGWAGALARAFERVAILNFSRSYSNYENPVCANVDNSNMVVSMTVPHDIIMTDRVIETHLETGTDGKKVILRKEASRRFYDDFVDEIWKPGYIQITRHDQITKIGGLGGEEEEEEEPMQYLTDYIVVGPVYTDLQQATVNMFLERKDGFISEDAVLLAMKPLHLGGVKITAKDFSPIGFEYLEHHAKLLDVALRSADSKSVYNWPQMLPETNEIRNMTQSITTSRAVNDWTITTGNTHSTVRFSLYTRDSSILLPSNKGTTSSSRAGATASPGATVTGQSHASVTLGSPVTAKIELSGAKPNQSDRKREEQSRVKGQSDNSAD